MGNREAKFRKVFEEIDMNGDHKVSFFELAAFIISPKAVHELEEFTKALFINNTTVNDLPNQFALVRLGKKVMWEVSHKYTSYQTLVKRPIE